MAMQKFNGSEGSTGDGMATAANQTCSATGSSSRSLRAGLWGPDEERLSRRVVGAGGEIPPATRPASCIGLPVIGYSVAVSICHVTLSGLGYVLSAFCSQYQVKSARVERSRAVDRALSLQRTADVLGARLGRPRSEVPSPFCPVSQSFVYDTSLSLVGTPIRRPVTGRPCHD